jgi:hypothetical protein
LTYGPFQRAASGRLLEQRLEPVLLRGITADLEAVEIEDRGDVLDLRPGGICLGTAQVFQHLGRGERRQQPEYHEHHQELDQREARPRTCGPLDRPVREDALHGPRKPLHVRIIGNSRHTDQAYIPRVD